MFHTSFQSNCDYPAAANSMYVELPDYKLASAVDTWCANQGLGEGKGHLPENVFDADLPTYLPDDITTAGYGAVEEHYNGDYQLELDLGDDFNLQSNIPFDMAISGGSASSDNSEVIYAADWVRAATADFHANPDESHRRAATDIDGDWVPEDVYQMGYQDEHGDWRCGHAGCRSRTVFERACDLRKHHSTHIKTFFCTRPECASSGVCFASQKDYKRHLRSHDPRISCPDTSCSRVFSRMDNLVSVRRGFAVISFLSVPLTHSNGSVSQLLTAFSGVEEPFHQDASAKAKHAVPSAVPKQG